MGFFTDLFSSKPQVPDVKPVDVESEQAKAVQGNIATFASAQALAAQYNDFMRAQVSKGLQESIPGLGPTTQQWAKNLLSEMKGELSPEQQGYYQRYGAAQAGASGTSGSVFGGAFTTRDLVGGAEGLKRYGEAQMPTYLGTMKNLYASPMFDPQSMFLSPTQRINAAFQNSENQWNAQWMKNQLDSQLWGPGRAFAGLGDQALQVGAAVGSAYAGNKLWGGGSGFGKPTSNWNLGGDTEYKSYLSGLRETGGPLEAF